MIKIFCFIIKIIDMKEKKIKKKVKRKREKRLKKKERNKTPNFNIKETLTERKEERNRPSRPVSVPGERHSGWFTGLCTFLAGPRP